MSNGVRKSYGEEMLEALKNIAKKCEKEVISLANLCLPELRTVLARQRRDYGISEDFPAQYPVEQQAANIDEAPVHNLDAERNFGKVDYRLKKIQSLEAVSRSLILQRAKDLIEEKETKAFRTVFRIQVTMPNKKRRDKTPMSLVSPSWSTLGRSLTRQLLSTRSLRKL